MGIPHTPTHYTENFSVPFLRIPAIYGTYYNMFVGWSNLFIAVYSLTGYGVKAVCLSVSFRGVLLLLGCACRVGYRRLCRLPPNWLTPLRSIGVISRSLLLHTAYAVFVVSHSYGVRLCATRMLYILSYIGFSLAYQRSPALRAGSLLAYAMLVYLLTSYDVMPLFFISFYAIIE